MQIMLFLHAHERVYVCLHSLWYKALLCKVSDFYPKVPWLGYFSHKPGPVLEYHVSPLLVVYATHTHTTPRIDKFDLQICFLLKIRREFLKCHGLLQISADIGMEHAAYHNENKHRVTWFCIFIVYFNYQTWLICILMYLNDVPKS